MSEFIEVLEWVDDTGRQIVHRLPPEGTGAIKFGAQLVVHENQSAVFFRDGRALDVLGPGRHTLTTQNLPLLTKALSLPFNFKSPFRVSVYFVSMKTFTNLAWGTRDPVAFRDKELGMVRLRGHGVYTIRVVQPMLFVNVLAGTQGVYTNEEISDFLRAVIISRINDLLGENLESLLELPQVYEELGAAAKSRVRDEFLKYGIELRDLIIRAITPPDDVQRIIDERGSSLPVQYGGTKPGNFDQADQVVVIGRYQEGVFLADQLLVKCPSKYQGSAAGDSSQLEHPDSIPKGSP